MILDEKMIYSMPWGPFPPGQPVSPEEAARGTGSKCFVQEQAVQALEAAQSVQVTLPGTRSTACSELRAN